ncbi:MAG: GtrA family protein [Clostridia bacterium]|nr:GtrA family protein [Clostridia bacterium]
MLQFLKFSIVGTIAALIDVGVLVILKELMHFDVLIASEISFCASVVVNYLLSMAFVFKSKNESKVKEFVAFFILSVGGLGLNQLILWLGVHFVAIHYLAVKVFAMITVSLYNFVTRKIFLESKEK